MRYITYGVERDTGLVISRVGSEIAHPVLEFEKIGMGGKGYEAGDFNGPMLYHLEKFQIATLAVNLYRDYQWTRKVPTRIKNRHRKFWGMKPLKYKKGK